MKTVFALMFQYDGLLIVPVEKVCRDYFPHLTPVKFLRKVSEFGIPVVRIEGSKRAARGVHVSDLAAYIDRRIAEARKECEQLRHTDPSTAGRSENENDSAINSLVA